jgi:acyl-CoA reductase-like NAD-dependent aldehyde dehydrogenase
MTTETAVDWRRQVQDLTLRTEAFIDGDFVAARSGERFDKIDPATAQVTGSIAACDVEDVDLAVRAARRAFNTGTWASSSPRERKAMLLRVAQGMEDRAVELASVMAVDVGKPVTYGLDEVATSAECLRYFAEAVDKIFGEIAPVGPGGFGYVTREAIGVVGAVVPWNYPLLMPMWKLGPALAAGNCVVVKPAEQSPLTALALAEIAAEAGLPPGVLNVVPGFGETAGQALGRHLDVDKLTFTGSGEVGRLFLKYAAESNLKRVSLECGGKSPTIVLADVMDLPQAATAVAEGIFLNAGQVCSACSRLLVQRSVKEELLEHLVQASGPWEPGDPLHEATKMGPVVDENQFSRVLASIARGREEGASVVIGGEPVVSPAEGYFVRPTIFTDVSNEMKLASEEIFGPVLSVIDFDTVHEAIALANDSSYGLAAGVWTRDVSTAHNVGRQLRAGSVYVNCWGEGDISMPFGGYKESGFGRDKSLHALDGYLEFKSTYIKLDKST